MKQLGRRGRESWGVWFRQRGSGQALPSCGLRISLCGLFMCTTLIPHSIEVEGRLFIGQFRAPA